jgi:YD repeat-containing protein
MVLHRRLLLPALLALAALLILFSSTPSLAAPNPPCPLIGIVAYRLDGHSTCPLPEYNVGRTITALDCETGAIKSGPGVCNSLFPHQWMALTGFPVGTAEEGCHDSPPGPFYVNTCSPEELPKCNQCPCNDATDSPAGLLGDPIDLTSGALKLTPTDVDLGGGLRFTRHYVSTRTATGPMGRAWRHGLEWKLVRASAPVPFWTPPHDPLEVFIVLRPLRTPASFVESYDGLSYGTPQDQGGEIAVDPDGTVHYSDADGTEADFSPSDQLVALRVPGELPIAVSYGANSATWSNGVQSLTVTTYAAGHANAGRVASVTAGGETWSYGYDASQNLTTVTAPPSPSDTIVSTYVYTLGRVTRLDRTAGGSTSTLATWTYIGSSPARVATVDEPALDQPLSLTYTIPETNRLKATVKNASSQTLAVFDSTNHILYDVSNTTGPAAPVAGGPGVPVLFDSATVETFTYGSTTSPTKRWHTQVDPNGSVTLYEDYDAKGRPGRIVEGWVDGLTAPGAFSLDDTWARRREYTYHPQLDEPLSITEESPLTGDFDKVTIFDFDDPLDPLDDPMVSNENPTKHLFARVEQGHTLDATGAEVPVTATTLFTYDAEGRVTSESGPRPESFTQYLYQAGTGYRTAVRRYLDGPSSTYLETTFSDFDARGNPETVTDPNGRETELTYDSEGRVKTLKPPFAGGDSTITSTYDVDGNLTRIDFPPDSFSQPYFVRMGYDAKGRIEFLADAQGNAIVYERTGGRVTREALYAGFVDLASRGTLKGDSTFSFDAAGRMLKAFNPLFGGGSVYSEFDHDAKGNATTSTDENGKEDNLLYDALDRLEEVAQVRGGTTYTTGFAHDPLSNVKEVTDPAGKSTEYLFDDLGRLVKVTSPNTGETLYLYDLAGNLTSKVEDFGGTGRTTEYEYDGLDRLTLVDFPTDADWVFTYDTSAALNQKGRLASVTNGVVTTELEYTAQGQVVVERTLVGGGSYAVTYGYDAGGNLTSLQAPSGVTTAYAYSGGRPKTVAVTASSETQTVRDLEFLPFGPRTRAEFPPEAAGENTVVSTRAYNLRYQVTEIDVTSPAGTVLDLSYTYGYTAGSPGPNDPGPNLDRVVDHRDGSESRFYFYDDLDRLWKATDLAGTPVYTFLYDANGNRTQQVAPSGTTSYSHETGTDRLAQATGAEARHYAHDAYGSRVWAGASAYAGNQSLVYDESNHLVEVRDPATFAVLGQYTHDAFGRRVRKIAGGVTTLFFHGPGAQLVEAKKPAASPASARAFVYIEEEPVGVVDQAAGGSPSFTWVHGDHLTTPRAVTRSPGSGSAAVIWRASFAPFGLATPDEDPDGDGQAMTLDIRVGDQLVDVETGLHSGHQRAYDAQAGRFLSPSNPSLPSYPSGYSNEFGDPAIVSESLLAFGAFATDTPLLPARRPRSLARRSATITNPEVVPQARGERAASPFGLSLLEHRLGAVTGWKRRRLNAAIADAPVNVVCALSNPAALRECQIACDKGDAAWVKYCQKLKNPRLAAGCWAMRWASKVACKNWCYWQYGD